MTSDTNANTNISTICKTVIYDNMYTKYNNNMYNRYNNMHNRYNNMQVNPDGSLATNQTNESNHNTAKVGMKITTDE